MIRWARIGRIVIFRSSFQGLSKGEIPRFDIVKIVSPTGLRDDKKMYVCFLGSRIYEDVSREQCFPIRKLKKITTKV